SRAVNWRTALSLFVVSGVVLSGFMFGYYGKEQWFRFSSSEYRAAATIFETAPKNSQVIDGTDEFPTEFKNQANFSYTAITSEPAPSAESVLRDPVNVLYSWMADTRFAKSYLIFTKSQFAESDNTGLLPRGSLQGVQAAL